ncbi:MAG: HAMP domain-containing protein [bacterium]|nr:HAMP domain-containing protein [bacterium]
MPFTQREVLKKMWKIRPFKVLKRFLPQTLTGRSLLILFLPLVFAQLIVTFVFLDRHWETVNRRLSQDIAGDIAASMRLVDQKNMPFLEVKRFARTLSLNLEPLSSSSSSSSSSYNVPSFEKHKTWGENTFNEALKNNLQEYIYQSHIDDNNITVDVSNGDYAVRFTSSRKRLFFRTTPILLMWMAGAPAFLFIIAALFMRGQTRPIRELSNAMILFGRGQEIHNFKPTGASEVRRAAKAFNLMRARLQRQLTQRAAMLAGVSHDLRTPLTRMELQLALMEESDSTQELRHDISQMAKTIDEYLAFARGAKTEEITLISLQDLIHQALQNLKPDKKIKVDLAEDQKSLLIKGRAHALTRALSNFFTNAQRYADQVAIHWKTSSDQVELFIDDNGPGIPLSERSNAFKPFFRLDKSRNEETGGTGLGLAIAQDILLSHGGTVHLQDSPLGGLRVHVTLPIETL